MDITTLDQTESGQRAGTKAQYDPNVVSYTGPGTLAGRYMRRFWHPVWASDELHAGQAIPVRIMNEDFTLYRGEKGVAHAVDARCAHRRTLLSMGFVEGDCVRCVYHGWKFNDKGECVERPAEFEQAPPNRLKVKAYPTREYLGLIFVYFGEGEPPPFFNFPEFEKDGLLLVNWYQRGCNYYQNIENGVDEAHLPFTHRKTAFDVLNRDVPKISARETEYGLVAFGSRSDGTVRSQHILMPNILTMTMPPRHTVEKDWQLYLSWRVPVDDLSHKTFIVSFLSVDAEGRAAVLEARQRTAASKAAAEDSKHITEEILAGKMNLFAAEGHPDFIGIQDSVAQIAQGVIVDRKAEILGKSDVAIAVLRRLWRKDLEHLTRGEEPTAWAYPRKLDRGTGDRTS